MTRPWRNNEEYKIIERLADPDFGDLDAAIGTGWDLFWQEINLEVSTMSSILSILFACGFPVLIFVVILLKPLSKKIQVCSK